MAFGGFFGGSSSGSDKSSSSSSSSSTSSSTTDSSSSSTDIPSAQAIFPPSSIPSSFSSNSTSSDIKNRLMTAISTQSNIINAKLLIQKINENCFDHCVTAPGTSLSRGENQCLSSCMEKYIDGWNTVSKTYVARLQREGAQLGLNGGAGGL